MQKKVKLEFEKENILKLEGDNNTIWTKYRHVTVGDNNCTAMFVRNKIAYAVPHFHVQNIDLFYIHSSDQI